MGHGVRFGRGLARGKLRHRRQGRAVESDLVALGRPVAPTFSGSHMNQDWARNLQRGSEDVLEAAPIVTGDDAQVCNAEILEELTRLGEVDHHASDSSRQLEGRLPHDGQRFDDPVVGGLALLPGAREFQGREVLAERAYCWADRHGVVVEDDQQLGLPVADVV